MNDCRHRAECLKWVPACLCNSCAYDGDEEGLMCCTLHGLMTMRCPMMHCPSYKKEIGQPVAAVEGTKEGDK